MVMFANGSINNNNFMLDALHSYQKLALSLTVILAILFYNQVYYNVVYLVSLEVLLFTYNGYRIQLLAH